jgi:hypothetical protein
VKESKRKKEREREIRSYGVVGTAAAVESIGT